MSPVVYREDESPAWATMAIVLVVLLAALLIGYFTWYRPTYINAEDRQPNVINVQPSQPAPTQPAPTLVPVPVPGPAGPTGPAGPQGPAGPTGKSATPSGTGNTGTAPDGSTGGSGSGQ